LCRRIRAAGRGSAHQRARVTTTSQTSRMTHQSGSVLAPSLLVGAYPSTPAPAGPARPAHTHTHKHTHTHTRARATPSTLQTLSKHVHPHAPHSESATDSRHKPDNCRFAPCIGRGAAPARPILARYVTTQRLRPPSVFVRTTSSAHAPVRSRTCVIEHGAARHCLGNQSGMFTDEDAGKLPSWASDRPKPEPKAAVHRSAPIHALSHHAHVRTAEGGRKSRVGSDACTHEAPCVLSVGWFAR
jgi:hypothetical protein